MNLDLRARARLGTTLRGKYTLERVLGVGGMATVYKAVHRNRAEFAVKMLHPELSHDEEVRRRFLREGYAANSVKHVGVVAVVDDDVADDGAAFIVMELLDGMSVEDLAQKHGGSLPVDMTVAVGCQLADVIAAAHERGILHRDIKPANAFLTRSGQVKLLDFGIARVRDLASQGAHATQSGVSFGTPAFMSPEQARGKSKEVGERSDVWAIGATLFALVTGTCVHEGESSNEVMVKAATQPARRVSQLAPHVPAAVAAVIDRALSFAPEQRWPTAAAMRDALATACRVPSNAELAAFLDATPRLAAAARMVDTRRLEATTAFPVATDRAKTRSRSALVAAICGVVLLVASIVLVGAYVKRTNTNAATSSTSTFTSTSTSTSVASTSTSDPAPTPAPTQTLTLPTQTLTLPTAPTPIKRPAAPKPSASASSKPGCDPNYTLDRDGEKHFKPECF